jgi:diguanylate cyclase (GGDEF)-like protein
MSLSTKLIERPESIRHDVSPHETSDLTAIDLTNLLNLVPTALICVNYSALRHAFQIITNGGVTDLRAFLNADPSRLAAVQSRLQVVTFNSRGLALYEAANLASFTDNLGFILRDDQGVEHLQAMLTLWEGETSVVREATHYTLSGRRFHARLKMTVMPGYEHDWSHVLFVIEDITEEEAARARLAASESYARALFQLAPVSLWVLDYSRVKLLLDRTRAAGVTDLRQHIAETPDFCSRYFQAMRIVDMNAQTLALFKIPDKSTLKDILRHHYERLFPEGTAGLAEEAICLWNGELRFMMEHKNLRIDGSRLDAVTHYAVLPGHEDDWSLVLVAEIDVTARKMAEERLEFLNGHDILTGLNNRMAYALERERLVRHRELPIGVMIADLNGLKQVNDRFGHEAGDMLLRRAGRVLREAVNENGMVARMGGDEFVILLPRADEIMLAGVTADITRLAALERQTDELGTLSFAIGSALCLSEDAVDQAVQQADMRMYRAKRAHYASV